LHIPNAFTPNNDGLNDHFKVVGHAIEAYSLNIFDRWGGKIYESKNIQQHWEGIEKDGYAAPQGAYVYVIKVKDVKGKDHEYTGTVTLLR
jgi:gliding motility-associated-like protein